VPVKFNVSVGVGVILAVLVIVGVILAVLVIVGVIVGVAGIVDVTVGVTVGVDDGVFVGGGLGHRQDNFAETEYLSPTIKFCKTKLVKYI
jgi:hypothetical protein